MAYFAEIKSDTNEVIRVIVVGNDQCEVHGGENSSECEQWVKEFHQPTPSQIEEMGGTWPNTYWKRTSYNTKRGKHIKGKTPFRGTFAGKGFIYNIEGDYFHGAKPHDSWIWDNETYSWQPPTGNPTILTYVDGEGNTRGWSDMYWSEEDLKFYAIDISNNKFSWNSQTQLWEKII